MMGERKLFSASVRILYLILLVLVSPAACHGCTRIREISEK